MYRQGEAIASDIDRQLQQAEVMLKSAVLLSKVKGLFCNRRQIEYKISFKYYIIGAVYIMHRMIHNEENILFYLMELVIYLF